MAKLEELLNQEQFVEKLSECDSDEKVAALYEEYNVELEEVKSEELSEEELGDVAGGKTEITGDLLRAIMSSVKGVFKATTSYAVIMLAWVDSMTGNVTRHYTESQIRKAAKNLGVGWMIK